MVSDTTCLLSLPEEDPRRVTACLKDVELSLGLSLGPNVFKEVS